MKSNQFIFLLIGVFPAICLCSCKKDNKLTQSDNQLHLKKVVSFRDTASTVTNATIEYYYDNAGRLQSAVTDINPPPPGAVIHYPDSLIYYYNGADTLPFKAIHYNRGTLSPTEYYTYDVQARILTYIYVITGFSPIALNYTYSPGQIIITGVNSFPDTLVYDGNNVTQDSRNGRVFNIQPSNIQNPFDLVSINRHKPYIPVSGIGEFELNRNAPSQVTDNIFGITKSYQYDNIINGFPGKVTATYDTTQISRVYFYYQ